MDLPLNNFTNPGCGKIKDPATDQTWIIIAGGNDPSRDVSTSLVYLWNPESNQVKPGPVLPFTSDGSQIIELTETEVLMLSWFDGKKMILSFSLENGWQTWGTTLVDISRSAAFIVPRHFGSCL